MPVRYDIAAQIPQISGGGMDPINALAQLQAMDYRRQQNMLAQMQMAEYQRRLQAEQALRGMTPNFEDPRFAQQAFQYDPEFARQLYGSRLAGERERRMAEQAAASAEATRGEQLLRQREFEEIKLPRAGMEKQKLGIETEKLGLEKEEAGLRGRKLQQDIRKFEEIEMPKAFSELEKARNEQKISNQEFLTKKAGYYRDYFKDFVTNQTTLDRLVDLMDQDKDFPAGGAAFRGVQFTPEWKASQLISPEKKAELARPEFEYQQVQDAAGNTRVVAIPKRAPERGAITVPGAEGAKPADYGFMPGPPDTGLVTRTNPRTGEAELVMPRQPIMAPAEGKFDARANVMAPAAPINAMTAPAAPAPVAPAPARGALIPSEIRPTAEAPVGSAAYNNKRFATEVLDASGFNSETGEDRVSNLIRKSTSGGLQAKAAGIRGFFGKAPEGMEAIGEIKTIINDAILKKLNGKLGAGISNEDREFIKSTLGNLDDPNIPANQRLASWNSAKRILMKYANTGQPAIGAPAGRPSLDEIFK